MSLRSAFLLRYIFLWLWSGFLLALTFSGSAFAASHFPSSPPSPPPAAHSHFSAEIRSALPLLRSHASGSRRAGDVPINVTSETYALHFPRYIDFTLTASDTHSAINAATISIQFKDHATSQATEQHDVRIVFPAKMITLHWREDTSGNNFHYPGTPVKYFWALQDQANNQYNDQGSHFTMIDTRFSWQHVSQGLLNVYWYIRPAGFGQTLLTRAQASITHTSQALGAGPLQAVNVWVYASTVDFQGALAPGAYEWIGGEAHPELNEAFISAVDDQDTTLVRDLPHELSHLVLHQLIAQGLGIYLPRWFDEGMAVNNQFHHEPEMQFRFQQALARHNLMRVDELGAGLLSPNGDTAQLAYAQSWNLVSYMYKAFGQAKMTALIQKMNHAQTGFGDDLTQALGVDQLHLENQWRLQLNQPSVLTPGQVTPTPAPAHTTSAQATPVDNTAPLLITLGAALILLPILGVAALLLYQRRKSQLPQAAYPPGQYMPFSHGMAGKPYVGQFEYPTSHQQGLAGRGHASEERKDAPQE